MRFLWKHHKAIGPLLVFLAVIVSFIVGYDVGSPPIAQAPSTTSSLASPCKGGEAVSCTVSIMLDFGDGVIQAWNDVSLATISDTTVWGVLQTMSQKEKFLLEVKEYDSLGVMVEKIGDKQNRGVEQSWQYWVNNEYATVSASKYPLSGGEVIEWKYVKGQL
ncbi:MAG: hypothetical protein UV70_C0002G0058 [Parcubacteria group bacterium GW2011_GWA2_43_13]|nr:MAG: hypothetical protein UV70_C0002G0058 [Parcubacteria group bacterium GW2011_GWA2_43_13]OGY68812.1 MAG: hypothetical protein A3B94_01650 [Candidatus Jacksonbacteria bacterium RIFCSPHIGHO2_02_FULL_43_10]OGY70529.1 MAG: hypothetical protein A2986_02285 [Candidatus Jacksonbacteria bacterium RIFCSPLOWO2_01_FULL_44_13]HAZ16295.1 hypothetical protein [Candidatus Jacksonbacteria bacterium]